MLCGPFRSYHEWEWSPNFRWVPQVLGYAYLLFPFYVLSYWGVKYGKCLRPTHKVVPIAGQPGWNMFSNQTPYFSNSFWSTDLMMDWHNFFGLIVTKFETAKQPIELLGLLIQNRITFSIQGQTRIWERPVVVYLMSKRRRNRRSQDIKCLMLMILIVNPFCMMTQTGNKWRLIRAVCYMYSTLTYNLTMLLSYVGLWNTIMHCKQYWIQYFLRTLAPNGYYSWFAWFLRWTSLLFESCLI